MKVLFLDIDGVLVTRRSIAQFKDAKTLDPQCVANLQRIVDATQTKIVVSSTWRLRGLGYVRKALIRAGLVADVIDVTPDLCTVDAQNPASRIVTTPPRREEIAAWLEAKKQANVRVSHWCVIDDEQDAGPQRLIRTDMAIGLTSDHANQAIILLGRGAI